MNTRDKKTALAKLEARSVKNSCWTWQGSTTRRGYGSTNVAGRTWSVHRLSWELHHGPIPPWMLVCHHCDTPACWNPEHLFLGTNADNVRDGRAKGRGPGRSGVAMNMQKAETIRRMWNTGKLDKHAIAQRLGLTWGQVHGVTDEGRWKA